jgi:MOSC domain-containing protein YiiM
MSAKVLAVSKAATHVMSKVNQEAIHLIAGLGVEGDAHAGKTVKHRSRVLQDPTQLNLRQVHLIHAELFTELGEAGFNVAPGKMGENITTQGLDVLALPTGSRLQIGATAQIEITGLRNPCYQLDGLQDGLLAATLSRDAHDQLVRKAGVMAIVLTGGTVRPGDTIQVELPSEPHQALKPI